MAPRRNRRAGVEDLWRKRDGTPTKRDGQGMRWRARYVDDAGREHTKRFPRKIDAHQWIEQQVASLVQGTHIAPRDAQRTVTEWCTEWAAGYARHRSSTVELAGQNITRITDEFGDLPLTAVRPSMVKAWIAKLRDEGLSDSYVYQLHNRLSQIMADAVHDGLLARNPCSRKTSPPAGKQKPYVASVEQLWAFHDAMPEHLHSAVLLGAFAGLRIAETAALRVDDVDFTRGIVHPKRQWPHQPLKTKASDAPVPIPHQLALLLSASVQRFPGENLVCNEYGEPQSNQVIAYHVRQARGRVKGLPGTFTYHDLRHFYASLLIAHGADVKVVQARLRHGSAVTTLGTYAHLWPDSDESTRTAVGGVLDDRLESPAYSLRTESTGGG